MKARLFGLIFVLAVVAGCVLFTTPETIAAGSTCSKQGGTDGHSSCYGWKNSYNSYCNSYTNLGCSPASVKTAGGKWFNILQHNDAAETTDGYCGATCSSNFFSTTPQKSLAASPSDQILVPANKKAGDKLDVYLYSSQRANGSDAIMGESTKELFIKSYIGSKFSYDKIGKEKGYVNNKAGVCSGYSTGAYISKDVVIQRPAISGKKGSDHLGRYGGTRSQIANDGVKVHFDVGWLKEQAQKYKDGKLSSPYVNVFQGYYWSSNSSNNPARYPLGGGGCANITMNAANIKVVPSGDIYPQLDKNGTSNLAMVGSNTDPVESSVLSTVSPYQIASKAAVYDFEAKTINDSALSNLFKGAHGTRDWSSGTNSVGGLCGKLSSLFGSGVTGITNCGQKGSTYTKKAGSYTSGPNTLSTSSLATQDKPVGTIMCRVVVTNNFNGDNNGTKKLRASSPACFIVGKAPKLSITGGDLRAGGGVDTSKGTVSKKTYGSWVEYGAFIGAGTQQNRGGQFGSGASFRNGMPSASSSAVNTNKLTFANQGGYGKFGDPSLSSLGSTYDFMGKNGLGLAKKTGSGSTVNVSGLDGFYDRGSSSISVSGKINHSVILKTTGTVTITGNITNSDTNAQLVIVANNINIKSGVTEVDAWLLAGKNLDTCSSVAKVADLTTKNCNKELKINGPVVSGTADFKRTANSDKDTLDDPAEALNLPSNTYLWEYRQSAKNTAPTTVQVTQLPPRY